MQINGQKIIDRLEELYACGKQEGGSHSRLAYSPEDIKGREKFIGWFKTLGITPHIDKAGNIICRMEGSNASLSSIIVGSHLDTVPDGGKYDGALGSVAGLAVCEAIIESGQKLNRPLEVIVFTDEEGARFGSGMVGSGAFASNPPDFSDSDKDILGMSRGEVYKAFGIDTATLTQAARPEGTVHCFIELHIEQGSALDKNKIPIGIVSSIAGVKRYEIIISGESNHAGSTLMADRKDSLVAAANFIAAVPKVVEKYGNEYTVATVGTIKVKPGSVNVIPGVCIFSLEIRDQSPQIMTLIEQCLRETLDKTCENLTCSFRRVAAHNPAPMTGWVRKSIGEACDELGFKYIMMPSGAFHDSLLIAEAFPTGMIFIPSVGGISHSPQEFSTATDVEMGCAVLLKTVLTVDSK